MALKSPASQSSETDAPAPAPIPAAARAVDGNRDPAQTWTCTVTKSESGPWWMVDLQKEYKIDAVAITSSASDRATLDGVEIWLGMSERLNGSKNIRWII